MFCFSKANCQETSREKVNSKAFPIATDKFLVRKGGWAVAQAAQGGGEVNIPGGVEESHARGTKGHG